MDENIFNIAIQHQYHCDMFTKTHYGILATITGRRYFIMLRYIPHFMHTQE